MKMKWKNKVSGNIHNLKMKYINICVHNHIDYPS